MLQKLFYTKHWGISFKKCCISYLNDKVEEIPHGKERRIWKNAKLKTFRKNVLYQVQFRLGSSFYEKTHDRNYNQ